MLFSYSDKHTPFVLSPESLDLYLAKGWYRMGANIFTTHFLFFKERAYSAIWLRLDLSDFQFSKSQRKLLRKNATYFAPAAAPKIIDAEREALYSIYSDNFDGRLSPSIADSLEDYGTDTVYNTQEITVREQQSGKLVATSYFDLGDTSAASILGFYHPDQRAFSLGYYTMLLEIEYCLKNGIRFYYPGYVAPGYDRFDYKLRLGKCEYYDLGSERWLPYAELDVKKEGPVETQRHHLQKLVDGLAIYNMQPHYATYPLFEAGLYDVWNENYVPYPYFYVLGKNPDGALVLVAFDPKEKVYFLLKCDHMVQTQLLFNSQYLKELRENNCFTDLLAIQAVLFRTPDTNVIIQACATILGH